MWWERPEETVIVPHTPQTGDEVIRESLSRLYCVSTGMCVCVVWSMLPLLDCAQNVCSGSFALSYYRGACITESGCAV